MNVSTDNQSSDSYHICNICQKVITNKEKGLRARSSSSGPSAFIPEDEILDATDARTELLLLEVYSPCSGLDHITQVMGLHPQYLQSFLQSQFYLLWMDGPLPLHCRQYIAIMAAARHQCSFLVKMHVQEFYRIGGPMEWLRGLQHAPEKLRNLNDINKILAHRPWLITKQHIQSVVKTDENSWSLAELVHAVVLLAHFHALASFVFGSGINPEGEGDGEGVGEKDENGFQTISNCSCNLTDDYCLEPEGVFSDSLGMMDSIGELEVLMERMKRLQEDQEEEEASQEEMATRFEREKKESLLVGSEDFKEVVPASEVSLFVEDAAFKYQDFARRGEDDLPTFRAQDYSWEDHGFSLVNRLYSDVGLLLDEKFRTVYNLTYYNMANHEDVDTTTLRRAIFNYVHCMYGIRYDDYDYGEVNQLLERSLKVYIKTVTCYPERTTCLMYQSYWRQFRHSEKVHVNLLLMEARMQAELLYSLRAITHYMT
ncbi:hypothetical protein AGOR_G00024400 [Albula goreensis]|uniref:Sestrin 3 n=1 Tax=Albula goreensis TaxID=1534307 RepID=A0A8T3E8R4_9TELE|nr:hypothetical protein AGOR_G00024400 [Albula goreensis]